MSKPQKDIDGANVLYWAWSGSIPFGYVGDSKDPMTSKIFGLAICQYENSDDVYRFSCDENWETQQDQIYHSVKEAMENLPDQYRNVQANWIKFED